MAIEMLENGFTPQSPYKRLVEDSRHLLLCWNCKLQHVLHEGKQCVDWLAKLGADQFEQLVVSINSPEEICWLLVSPNFCCPDFCSSTRAAILALERALQFLLLRSSSTSRARAALLALELALQILSTFVGLQNNWESDFYA
ncbi:hypothetical protein ACSBR1_038701 [Camellia fascicularis]